MDQILRTYANKPKPSAWPRRLVKKTSFLLIWVNWPVKLVFKEIDGVSNTTCKDHRVVRYVQCTLCANMSPYMHAGVSLCAYIWFIMYACRGNGTSQKDGDQSYDHKTNPACAQELPVPICPIKKLLPAGMPSESLFMGVGGGGTRGQRDMCFSMHLEKVWRVPESEDLDRTHLQIRQGRYNKQFVSAKVFVLWQASC